MFLAFQAIIYFSYLYMDINHIFSEYSAVLKFISIVICFLHVNPHNESIKKIMALTVISDFFLVLTNAYWLGIIFFIAVQLAYYQLIEKETRFPISHLAYAGFAGFLVSIFINFLIKPIDFLTFLCAVYFITLLSNVFICIRQALAYREYEYILLSVCLLLIMLCDIHVGISNILSTGAWYNFALIAMWLFYLPSQVLISQAYSTKSLHRRYR